MEAVLPVPGMAKGDIPACVSAEGPSLFVTHASHEKADVEYINSQSLRAHSSRPLLIPALGILATFKGSDLSLKPLLL
jgi:hypothetical protein